MRRQLWPQPGEHHSLVESHNAFFRECFGDLMKWIVCVQENHTDVHPACSTYVDCGKTIFDAPIGVIDRVYAIANGDWCSKVFYQPATFDQIECWSRNLLSTFVSPVNAGLPGLQQGYKYVEAATDSQFGRSRVGLYCIHRKRLYLVPWVQSNESVIVEWDGQKWYWADDDVLDENLWTPDYDNAIKLFVKHHHARDYEPAVDRGTLKDMLQEYYDARAMLIHSCMVRIETKEMSECSYDRPPTTKELKAEAVPADPGPEVASWIGDFGIDNANELAVSKLVKSWNPNYIITSGDNFYGPGNTGTNFADLDAAVGKYYGQFIFPYKGTYTGGAAEQKFHICIGNHDRAPEGRLSLELDYFSVPTAYYEVVRGAVHYLFYDSAYDNSQVMQQPDGNDINSKQAIWLQTKLALSTAPFRVVVIHHPPFSSTKSAILVPPLAPDGTISFPALQLPFKAWGADVVFSGHVHDYEVLIGADGMLYICNGSGGASGQIANEPAIYADNPSPLSVFRYNSKFGAQKIMADCKTLTMEFWSTDGELIDSRVITK